MNKQQAATSSPPQAQTEAPMEAANGGGRQARYGNQFLASFLGGGGGGGDLPHRAAMERAFGRDLSHVRALTGVEEVRGFGANALTQGDRVAFADDNPSADTVGHEVAHVTQSEGGGTGGDATSKPGESAEQEAADAGRNAASGKPVGAMEETPSGQVQGDWLTGAAIGAGVGGLVGGPVGAIAGGLLGAWLGDEETLEEFKARTFAPLADFKPSSGDGLFDVQFTPDPAQLRIVLKLSFNFTSGTAANVAPGYRPEEFNWTDAEKDAWKARYMREVGAMWSGQHSIRSTRQGWETYQVPTVVSVQEDAADPHFVFSVAKYPADADMNQSSICPSGTHHDGTGFCPANPADAAGNTPNNGTADMDSNDMRPEQKLDWGNASTPVYFSAGSRLDATAKGVLDGIAATLTANAAAHVQLTGHASLDHRNGADAATGTIENMDLARARSEAVKAYLTGKGVAATAILVRNAGEQGATAGSEATDRRVDLQVGTHQTQNPGLHETGHMLGLGDEYTSGGSAAGDAVDAGYSGMVHTQTGQTLTQANDESAMSMGSTVRLAHYSSFLEGLKNITDNQDWRL